MVMQGDAVVTRDPNTFAGRRKQLDKFLDFTVDMSSWTGTAVNGGSRIETFPTGNGIRTGATANASYHDRTQLIGLGIGIAHNLIDWDKELSFRFRIMRATSDAEAVSHVQLKDVHTIGDLGEKGIGLCLANLALTGEAHGASRGTVNLSTNLVDGDTADIEIHLTSAGVDFFVDGVLKGSITTAGEFPTGDGAAPIYVNTDHANGGSGNNTDFHTTQMHITQAK